MFESLGNDLKESSDFVSHLLNTKFKRHAMDNYITVVSGLPRSGTSMMMRMLELGGIEVVTDQIREADTDNPLGYYEFEQVKKISENTEWLRGTEGKVFKMISMLLQHLPSDYRYKIVFMRRDIREILASQAKMMRRMQTKGTDLGDEEMARLYERHLAATEKWLGCQPNIQVHYASYNDILHDAQETISRLVQFLGRPLRMADMLSAIDSSLYRNRAMTQNDAISPNHR